MEIPNTILNILSQNHWDKFNFQLMQQSYLEKLKRSYSKYDFSIKESLLEKISLFYNMKLKFEKDSNKIVFFDINKINKYRQYFLDLQAAKFNVNKVVYIGDIHPGYVTIWIDENENIWGDYDNIIYLYGNSLYSGIENILKDKKLKTISI